MRLVNGAGGVMYASGEVAEFYVARGWRDSSVAPKPVVEPAEAAPKRTTRRRKADNGVDTA